MVSGRFSVRIAIVPCFSSLIMPAISLNAVDVQQGLAAKPIDVIRCRAHVNAAVVVQDVRA
jgi:hypothetical protein